MKLITDSFIDSIAGKTVVSAVKDGNVCIIFDDDTYLVVQREPWSEDAVELLSNEGELELYEKRNLGIITQDEYDQKNKEIKDGLKFKARSARMVKYEELKKEFGDD